MTVELIVCKRKGGSAEKEAFIAGAPSPFSLTFLFPDFPDTLMRLLRKLPYGILNLPDSTKFELAGDLKVYF